MTRSLGMKFGVALALGATMLLAACGTTSTSGNTVSCPSAKNLNGAGATFPNLIYSQMFAAFAPPLRITWRPVVVVSVDPTTHHSS